MKYGIASYKRPKCRTVSTLLKAGIDKSDICIAVQTQEDYERYSEIHEGIKIIYEPNDCAAGNRNTILDYANAPIWLLDDDLTGFSYYTNNFHVETKRALDAMEELAQLAQDKAAALVGLANTNSNIIAKGRSRYSYDCILTGGAVFINDCGIRFNENWKMIEDYELSLRVISLGGKIIRANYICPNHPANGSNEGGLHDRYATGQLPTWIKRLANRYPQFKPNKTFTGGMLRRG